MCSILIVFLFFRAVVIISVWYLHWKFSLLRLFPDYTTVSARSSLLFEWWHFTYFCRYGFLDIYLSLSLLHSHYASYSITLFAAVSWSYHIRIYFSNLAHFWPFCLFLNSSFTWWSVCLLSYWYPLLTLLFLPILITLRLHRHSIDSMVCLTSIS